MLTVPEITQQYNISNALKLDRYSYPSIDDGVRSTHISLHLLGGKLNEKSESYLTMNWGYP
jgi:hypothetical protein